MEGKSLEDYTNKVKADPKTAVMGSWAVWVRSEDRRHGILGCVGACSHHQLCLIATPSLHQHYPDRIRRILFIPWKQEGRAEAGVERVENKRLAVSCECLALSAT